MQPLPKPISFTKMHACGNDYIYINLFSQTLTDKSIFAKRFSNRNFSIGGDGVIFLVPPNNPKADFKMEIYNADGSFAEMCGNGIRCATVFARNQGIIPKNKTTILVESANLLLQVEFCSNHQLKVHMGKPIISILNTPLTINQTSPIRTYLYDINCVSMGNPHCVIFTNNLSNIDLNEIGPLIEHHELFPNRTNVEFVQIVTPNFIKMRVWERGSGETLACGTGCCAAVAVGIQNQQLEDKVMVQVLGGELLVEYEKELDTIYLIGDAVTVFEGEILFY